MKTDAEKLASLADFLQAFGGVNESPLPPNRLLGLTNILSAIGDYRAAMSSPAPVAARRLDTAEFPKFLLALRCALADARKDGRLLNVWTLARLGRDEVRTAAVLTWVLDCYGSHGYGSAVLDALLSKIKARMQRGELDDIDLGQRYRTTREHSPFGDQSNRIDIMIEGGNCVIFLEVKIDAPPGHEQLQRYKAASMVKAVATQKKHSRLLYLSQSSPKAAQADVIFLTWADIRKSIQTVIRQARSDDISGAILRQFASHLKKFK